MADNDDTQRQFDEPLDREGGVFAENDAREVVCDEDSCAPDDIYGTDPDAREGSDFPGTVDDRPIDFGEEVSSPNDQHLTPEGGVAPGGETRDREDRRDEQGSSDESELWQGQQVLVSEDAATGLRLQGFSEEEIPEILEAMGDDAAEVMPDYGEGVSASGDWNTPEHGGFPERED